MQDNFETIELHYFLNDNSHKIDAFVRHKCETEFLSILKEVSLLLEIKVSIETEAYAEGGVKEFWTFLGKNNNQLVLLATLMTLILSRVPMSESELEKLQAESTKLDIEERKLRIEKLKKELHKPETDTVSLDAESTAQLLHNNKILKHKSNFYGSLSSYPKVSMVSFGRVNSKHEAIDEPKFVDRDDFAKFVLASDELPTEVDSNAVIEIISPVLKSGNYKWKGIYRDSPIDFYMKDPNFKSSVIKQEVTFKSGFCIECDLEISKKIDDFGNEKITKYSVTTVTSTYDGSRFIETDQGKRLKKLRSTANNQLELLI